MFCFWPERDIAPGTGVSLLAVASDLGQGTSHCDVVRGKLDTGFPVLAAIPKQGVTTDPWEKEILCYTSLQVQE